MREGIVKTSDGYLTLVDPRVALDAMHDAEEAATHVDALHESWRGKLALWIMPKRPRAGLRKIMRKAATYHTANKLASVPLRTLYDARPAFSDEATTCGCGVYIDPSRWNPLAIHCSDCEYATAESIRERAQR